MFRRYPTIIYSMIVAFLAWILIPSTALDRAFFHLMASCFYESPYFVSGKGSYSDDYALKLSKTRTKDLVSKPLAEISITEDEERIFQSSPPSPLDFAVILKNLRRMGRSSVAIGLPLAWPDADMISHAALEQQLAEFDQAITSAPLSRRPTPSALPMAFRRASIALSQVKGDIHLLPIVNFVSMPNVVLGKKSSWAGFLQIESEPESSRHRLMALWDDRVVLSFPLLAAIQQLKAKPEDIEVRLGQWISLSKKGPFIPIDEFGRLALTPSDKKTASIPAGKLIDAPDDFLASHANGFAFINNGLSTSDGASNRIAEENTRDFASICSRSLGWHTMKFKRLPWYIEMLLIDSLLCLIFGLRLLISKRYRISLAVLTYLVIIFQFALFGVAQIWLPFPALILACAIALLGDSKKQSKKSSRH